MKSHNPFGPKTLIASVLIAFAMVGTAMAVVYSDLRIAAPLQGSVVTTNSPAVAYDRTAGGPTPSTINCGFDVPVWNTAPVGSTCVAPGNQIPSTSLADGTHTFVLQYYPDSSGATGVAATAFVVDTTPPAITITSPANGSTIVDETPTISFSITGSNTAGTAECSFDGAPFSACGPQFVAPELAEGQHTLVVRAADDYGNSASASVTFTIDLSAPLDDPLPPEAANVTKGKSKYSRRRTILVPVKGQILPSPDVSPKAACTGRVKITIKPKVRRAKTYKKYLSLKRSGTQCRASGSVRVPRKYKRKKATLRMYFGGNDYMSKISVRKTVRL